jgi:hypothetical protein
MGQWIRACQNGPKKETPKKSFLKLSRLLKELEVLFEGFFNQGMKSCKKKLEDSPDTVCIYCMYEKYLEVSCQFYFQEISGFVCFLYVHSIVFEANIKIPEINPSTVAFQTSQ